MMTINFNATTPAAPAGTRNVVWRNDVSGNISASLPTFGPSGAMHAPGGVPDPGASAGTTHFLREDGTWAVPSGSGGSLPSGFPVVPGVPIGSNSSGWSNYTAWCKLGHFMLAPNSSWKFRLAFTGGTGVHIASSYVITCAKNTLVPTASTTVLFSGSGSLNQSFGGTASTSNPFYLDCDTIALSLSNDNDYYISVYLDNDSGGSNYNASVGLNQNSIAESYMGANYQSGDHHADNPLTISGTTNFYGFTQIFTS